jgi:hypothetical protein
MIKNGELQIFGVDTFGEEGLVQLGLGADETAFLPVAADEGIDVELFDGRLGIELGVVVGGERFVVGGIFAGEHGGSGVHTYV